MPKRATGVGQYYVQSGNGKTLGEPRAYRMPNEAKQQAVKRFREFEDVLLRYDKEAHEQMAECIRAIEAVSPDAGWLGAQSDWANSSRDQPMTWSCPAGWGVVLTVRMWKAGA